MSFLRVLTVTIPEDDWLTLVELAEREYRRPKDQAGLLLAAAIRTAAKRRRRDQRDVSR